MYQRILVAVDGSPAANAAIQHGVRLAKATEAFLLFVHVSPSLSAVAISNAVDDGYENPLWDLEQASEISALNAFEPAASLAKQAGLQFRAVHTKSCDFVEAILTCATANQCDLIVIGAIGRGMQRFYGRHVRKGALKASSIPLLVAH